MAWSRAFLKELEAQRIAVLLLHTEVAAVGCVLTYARAPQFLEAVFVDPHLGAAAGAWLHEWAAGFIAPAQPAHLLLLWEAPSEGARNRGLWWTRNRSEGHASLAGQVKNQGMKPLLLSELLLCELPLPPDNEDGDPATRDEDGDKGEDSDPGVDYDPTRRQNGKRKW